MLTQLEQQLMSTAQDGGAPSPPSGTSILDTMQRDLAALAVGVLPIMEPNSSAPVVISAANVTLTLISAAAAANESFATGSREVLVEVGGTDGTPPALVYIPMETLEAAGIDATDGPLNVAITVYSGTLADAIMREDGTTLGHVGLSSSVVDVSLIGADGVRVALNGAFTVVPAMINPPSHGGGVCLPSELLSSHDFDVTCLAGCCVPPSSSNPVFATNASDRFGTCVCRTSQHRGALCDVELACDLVQERGGFGSGERACHTSTTADGMEACTCRRMGAIAIFAHTVYPATAINLDGDWPAKLAAGLSRRGGVVAALIFAIASIVGILSFEAWSRDRTALYVAKPPAWLRAPKHGWTMLSLLWHNVRLYHSLAGLYSTVPGHVPHTAMQNLVLLLCRLSLQALMVVSFVGAQQCTANQTILAGMLSAIISAPIVFVGRLLFRHAALESRALRRVFAANEALRRTPYPFRSVKVREDSVRREKKRAGVGGVRTTDLDCVVLVNNDGAGASSGDAKLPTSADLAAIPNSSHIIPRQDTSRTQCVYLHADQLAVPPGRTCLGFFLSTDVCGGLGDSSSGGSGNLDPLQREPSLQTQPEEDGCDVIGTASSVAHFSAAGGPSGAGSVGMSVGMKGHMRRPSAVSRARAAHGDMGRKLNTWRQSFRRPTTWRPSTKLFEIEESEMVEVSDNHADRVLGGAAMKVGQLVGGVELGGQLVNGMVSAPPMQRTHAAIGGSACPAIRPPGAIGGNDRPPDPPAASVTPPPSPPSASPAPNVTGKRPYFFLPVDLVEGSPLRDCFPHRRALASTGSEDSPRAVGGAGSEDSPRAVGGALGADDEGKVGDEDPAMRAPLCVWFDVTLLAPIGLKHVHTSAVPSARVAIAAISQTPVSANLMRQHLRGKAERQHMFMRAASSLGASAAAESNAPGETQWPPLRVWSYTPRLAFAWIVTLGVLLVANFWLLYFVAVAFDEQLEMQSKQAGEYLEGLLEAYAVAFAQSLLVQESLKVIVISLISPQLLVDRTELRVGSRREALRLCVRGLLNTLYGLLVFLL